MDSSNKSVLSVYSLYHPKPIKKKHTFSIDNLKKVREVKKQKIEEEYTSKYNECLKTIEQLNDRDESDMIFTIPKFIYECPEYEPKKCLYYIKNELKNNYNIDSTMITPYSMFVTWFDVTHEDDTKNNF